MSDHLKCKYCNSENLEVMVDVTMVVPIDFYHALSKSKLKDPRVELWSAAWNKSNLFCKDCGCQLTDR